MSGLSAEHWRLEWRPPREKDSWCLNVWAPIHVKGFPGVYSGLLDLDRSLAPDALTLLLDQFLSCAVNAAVENSDARLPPPSTKDDLKIRVLATAPWVNEATP
jgi:hypothetical protein